MNRISSSNPLVLKALGQELERVRLAGTEIGTGLSEHDHAVKLVQWINGYAVRRWPHIDLIFAVPNGGKRDRGTAGKMKAEGQKAGVSDYMLPVPADQFHGLFLELKAIGEKPTAPQLRFLDSVRLQGYRATWAAGWIAAANEIERYLR